jgi:glycosyltransferase involved in cell wall biosynthesis
MLANFIRTLNKLTKRILAGPTTSANSPSSESAENTHKAKMTEQAERPNPHQLPYASKPKHRFSTIIPMASKPSRNIADKPLLTVIVIVYDMPEQADITLQSLEAIYQRQVREEDYEILVVENHSKRLLGEERVLKHGKNFRYLLRHETEPTPIHAVNEGVEKARADYVSIMIDGARMLSPGIINYTLAALRLADEPVICVPGYHLGKKVQQEAMLEGYNEEAEAELLQSINWPEDGYRLFEVSCYSATSRGGYFKPLFESNCLCVSKNVFERIGRCDVRFNETGGGQVNLDLYKQACELKDTTLITLAGEGSFHQFHGGVTTGQKGDFRQDAMRRHFAQYAAIRGGAYIPSDKRNIILGAIHDSAVPFLHDAGMSAMNAIKDFSPHE